MIRLSDLKLPLDTRIACDPIVYFNRARNLCRQRDAKNHSEGLRGAESRPHSGRLLEETVLRTFARRRQDVQGVILSDCLEFEARQRRVAPERRR